MLFSIAAVIIGLSTLTTGRFASTPISQLRKGSKPALSKRDVDPGTLYPAYSISVPVDHFHNESMYEPHSNDKFNLTYFFDAQYYKPGGPVIVLASGEDAATDRLPYLQKGILQKLAQATNGIGVILEHRYYGTSFPTPDLSTANLRFLTTQQALADTTYFAKNVRFPGLEAHGNNLTAPHAAYIAYGGSYAGAFAGFLRTTYPDVFYGSIASSGVTKAIWDYWDYYTPVAEYGDSVGGAGCIENIQKLTHLVDNILIGKNNSNLTTQLKAVFGLQEIVHVDDFANLLTGGVGGWQGRNWDPAVDDPTFTDFCKALTANTTVYPGTKGLTKKVKYLVEQGGYANDSSILTHMLNYIGYVNDTVVSPVLAQGQNLDNFYSTYNESFYAIDSIVDGSWRSWPYQYCTQWGFLQTGSGVPADQLPLISRTITLEFESIICRDAFNLTKPADVDVINAYGGYDIAYNRLAIIDGEDDPWRGATPHAPAAKPRTSTTEEPYILIHEAVHHWDENGLFPNETTAELPPAPIVDVQSKELAFVKAWMVEWKAGNAENSTLTSLPAMTSD